MAAEAAFWDSMLPAFTPLLKKITDAAKKAHEELVVTDFEKRLNAEYITLTEKDMAAFGVTLARKGSDALVTVLPQIGGKEIEGVLSEGEQRVHALALFFAELETCPQSVLVFDDPISSFDYNYIANYCARLRDFALKHPGHQTIVLTHNWEFFVQLQTTLNSGGLDPHVSVQVLENCSVVADYSEKSDELKADITAVLNLPGEPTKAQKEDMAGKMRRLIEAVVNTHVFNSTRQQYKQRKHSVSEFHRYTKLVRLETAEATTLRDLYAKLSITEHDDTRNAYVNTDKATFQSRYGAVVAVENAVISRK
ncbi:MAG: AAA family ATPase [Sulfuricaulis sp.]|nr:AAA family ATPase [Sulfuricaulis sp.]